jgi:hypothetical protein
MTFSGKHTLVMIPALVLISTLIGVIASDPVGATPVNCRKGCIFFENCWWSVRGKRPGQRTYKKLSCPDLHTYPVRGLQRPSPDLGTRRPRTIKR